MQTSAPRALDQQLPATIVPAAAALEEGRRFLAAGRRVFARGCRCPLQWNGARVFPALPCDRDGQQDACPLDGSEPPR